MGKTSKRAWKAAEDGDDVWCIDDPNHHCHNFSLFIATDRAFQPPKLREASNRINEMLRDLREDAPPDRSLVLLATSLQDDQGGHGLLLAYAQIRAAAPSKGVTYDNEEGEIRDALGLLNEAAGN
jgi:hypothetical protein